MLEALGVQIDLAPEQVGRCIAEIGFGFLFAPRHHLAMRHVVPVRRELGVATIFNLLGPLTNPAGAKRQLIGVADARYVDRIAHAVRLMGTARNLIVHSEDGLDEISTTSPTLVVEVFADKGTDVRYNVEPEQFGLQRARLEALRGGGAEHNAALVREVLDAVAGPRLRHRAAERRRGALHRRDRPDHRRGRRDGAGGGRLRGRPREARRPRDHLAETQSGGACVNGERDRDSLAVGETT